tara:strand:- start:3811 stop:4197 length:387 start_codon:yes stop_codon:yes gene_type:complete
MDSEDLKNKIYSIDGNLSKRPIELDSKGYFIIKADLINQEIIAEYYLNNIDDRGIAIDPKTNKPIKCDSKEKRKYNAIFFGRTAKELGILITEKNNNLISKLDHALYLGRELQKAEECLLKSKIYIQD